jgi:hypothetical protein
VSHVIARRTWRQQLLHGTKGRRRKRIRRWLATLHWIWMCQLGRMRTVYPESPTLSSAAIGALFFSVVIAGLWAVLAR